MVNVATHRQIAVVLEELSQEVEALGATLCVDMDIAMRHIDTLQAIDLIAQKQRSLAALLEADCPEAEVEQIAIDTLRERLRLLR
jgi:CheY-like chemotaxis protein